MIWALANIAPSYMNLFAIHMPNAPLRSISVPTSHRTVSPYTPLRDLLSKEAWVPHRVSGEIGNFGFPLER
jgi:hypothetical protein